MQTLVIVFLAVIALTSLLQAGAAVAAAIAARKLEQRFDELESRFEREVRPGLAKKDRSLKDSHSVEEASTRQDVKSRRR